jgi:hypothetical protein|tara:strand:- start:175 stop:645 length:471 start_codon:yes stop_codon:yes gene_type:complete
MKLFVSEILTKVSKLKSKKEKVAWLKEQNTNGLRMVIKSSFDPKIKWLLPEGDVPFTRNDAPEGTEHTDLHMEASKLYHFLEGGNNDITQSKRETLFIQMLEGLQENDADVLVSAMNKSLHRKFKGLSDNVVKEAFDWDNDYMQIEGYPQEKGTAS